MIKTGIVLKCATCKTRDCNQTKFLKKIDEIMLIAKNDSELIALLEENECKEYEEE